MAGQYLVNCKCDFSVLSSVCFTLQGWCMVLFRGSPLVLSNPPLLYLNWWEREAFLAKKHYGRSKQHFLIRRQFARLNPTKNQIFHSDTRNVGIPAHWIMTLKRYFFYEYPPHPGKSRNNQLSVTIQSSVQCIWHREFGLYFSTGLGVCPILWCLLSLGLFASPILAGMQRIGGLDGQRITSQLRAVRACDTAQQAFRKTWPIQTQHPDVGLLQFGMSRGCPHYRARFSSWISGGLQRIESHIHQKMEQKFLLKTKK